MCKVNRWLTGVSSFSVLLSSGVASAGARELTARWWINNPPYRLHDDRAVVLFFFDCQQRESAEWARRLCDVSRRPKVVVIGLTADPRSAAERFVERYKIPFTIGAGSDNRKAFGIEKLPAILVVRADRRSDPLAVSGVEELGSALPAWTASPEELEDAESLVAYIESDARGMSRAAALDRL